MTRGPFRPFAPVVRDHPHHEPVEGIGACQPPWFVDSRTGATVSEGFTGCRMDGNLARMAGTYVQAFRA